MNVWAVRRGFTIVELIISMTIIAILAAIVFISYTGIQQRTRDSVRETDITKVKLALEKYYADNSSFPAYVECSGVSPQGAICNLSTNTVIATALVPKYIAAMPTDPRSPTRNYQYIAGGTYGSSYMIRIQNEAAVTCVTGVRMQDENFVAILSLVANDWLTSPTC